LKQFTVAVIELKIVILLQVVLKNKLKFFEMSCTQVSFFRQYCKIYQESSRCGRRTGAVNRILPKL